MKVGELVTILEKIDPKAEFDIYSFARKLDVEDFTDNLEYLGILTDKIDYDTLIQMNDDLLGKLANDDTYNQIYLDTVREVAKENNLEVK